MTWRSSPASDRAVEGIGADEESKHSDSSKDAQKNAAELSREEDAKSSVESDRMTNTSFEASDFLQTPPSWWQPSMPVAFAPLAAELAAARSGSALADGSMFAALEMTGPDRHDFLNRLLTNTVPSVPGTGCRAYYLSVMGRPLVQFFVFERAGGTLLICPASQREAAFAELDKMHFGEKLRLQPLDLAPLLLFQGTKGNQRLSEVGNSLVAEFDYFSCPHQLWLQPPDEALRLRAEWGQTPIGAQALEVLRIEAGTPCPGDAFEKTLFLEIAGPEDYSETKGCYPGQEVVARTLHRGHINRHLETLTTSGAVPPREARLLLGDREVGTVASAVRTPDEVLLLAFLRREVWEICTRLTLQGSDQEAVVAARRP